jgi:hypothetical protein
MEIYFKTKISNKEEFMDLVNDLKEKIEEVQKAVDKINNFELNLDMELSNKKEVKIMDKNKKAPNSFKLDAEMDDLIREKVNEVLKENHPVKIDIATMVSVLGTTSDGIAQSMKVNKSKK